MIKSATENINSIISMKSHGAFQKYIDFIHFPFYRNMEINSRINFEFPLTAIVGQNGCGKSSILHALSGIPKGKTPARFWFDTDVDPIIYYNDEKKRHSFWYQFEENGINKQVVKARIKRDNNPNNWETNRPLLWAGMNPTTKREAPIEKNLIYIDFRSELSAFDKFFYFGFYKKEEAKNKQEFIRNRSKLLSKAFTGYINKSTSGKELNSQILNLSKPELDAISFILGRNYVNAKSVDHTIFNTRGYSILFQTDHANYSEAFAGSGETAVVRLVLEVLSAPEYSLILLDEPEVSLHPGAQIRLGHFLLEEIKKKKHQIILTTHSPSLITGLPKEAIKIIYQNPENGRFGVKENLTPSEAFYHIEFIDPNKRNIYFEDKLAKEIVSEVLNTLGPEKKSVFNLVYNPGGCSSICKDFIPVFCRETKSLNYIFFDGDQKFQDEKYDWRLFQSSELTSKKLKIKCKNITRVDIDFAVDGSHGIGSEAQKIDLYKNYLDFYLNNVHYLPELTPEEIIWDDEIAKNFLRVIYSEDISIIDSILSEKSYKKRFSRLCNAMYNQETSEFIFSLQKLFIKAWINKKNKNYTYIEEIISSIL